MVSEIDVPGLLARARHRGGLGREALAQAAGTSRGAIASYELGRKSPTVRTLDRLLAACGLQARVLLEPLMADLDARVDALEGALPALDEDSWRTLGASLDDLPGARDSRIGVRAPRRGPVTWAVDGPTALVLHGLAAEPAGLQAMDVVVQLDEALRFWMKAVNLRGVGDREELVQDWFDADLERMVGALGAERWCVLGFVRVRVVEQMPSGMLLIVPWLDRPIPVVSVDEVERTNPVYAEVLARWRSRRES